MTVELTREQKQFRGSGFACCAL